jgi:glutaredoxin 3
MKNPIVIYSKPHCPYCDAAKELLRSKGALFQEIDISESDALREEMILKSQRKTVPQIFIGKTHVGGFDDLSALERQGQLDLLLQ